MRPLSRWWWLFLAGCAGSAPGTAHIVRGAAKPATARTTSDVVAPAIDGHWLLTPNASTVTLTQLHFGGDSGATVDLGGCTPSYQRDAAELTSILDCAFEIPAGTYRTMSIGVAGDAQVTVDDPAHGLFTDASAPGKLAGAAPAGGAQSVTVTVPTSGDVGNTIETAFEQPLVVSDGSPVTITLLEDMIHTMAADVSGGSARFDLSLPLPPVFLVANAGDVGAGSVEYYAPSGTADNFTNNLISSGNEAGSMRVFFVDGKPRFGWHVVPANSEVWAADPRGGSGSRPGGYLGLDAAGTLCWAHTNSDRLTWDETGYFEVCRMKRAANVGDTTTIECAHGNTAPPPSSGATYESGCPSFTPDDSLMVTLVAK